METSSGDFEVVDLCFAGLPDLLQPEAGPSNGINGSVKGKERAKQEMDVDGATGPCLSPYLLTAGRYASNERVRRAHMGGNSIRAVSGSARSTCGSQGGIAG